MKYIKTFEEIFFYNLSLFSDDINIVKNAIEKGEDINGVIAHLGTPLIHQTIKGNLSIVKYLVENGANINKFFKNETVLAQAILQGTNKHIKIAEYLIESGANTDVVCKKDNEKYSAIDLVCIYPIDSYFEFLIYLFNKKLKYDINKVLKTTIESIDDDIDLIEFIYPVKIYEIQKYLCEEYMKNEKQYILKLLEFAGIDNKIIKEYPIVYNDLQEYIENKELGLL